jgi:hypothetical protein
MTLFLRRTVFAFVLGAALTAAVFVGRAAHATTGEIDACFKPSNGTLYLLGGGSGRTECQSGDIPISWNTVGVNGQDGVSVTSQSLAPGDDPACPNGGSKFTAENGVSYACNGSNGQNGQNGENGQDGQDGRDGLDGRDGQDGQDFSGTFTSPNGQYKLVVDDTKARLEGPLGRVEIVGNGVQIEGPLANLKFLTNEASLNSTGALTLHAQSLFSASGAVTALGGSPIILNGTGCGLLRPTDVASAVGTDGGTILLNPAGTLNVRTSC